mgnify:CR=1 FL=1
MRAAATAPVELQRRPRRLGDGRAHQRGAVVHRHHRVNRPLAGVLADRTGRRRGIVEGQREQMIGELARHDIRLLGGHHEVHVEATGRLHEVLGAVGAGGDQEEETLRPGGGHGALESTSDADPM